MVKSVNISSASFLSERAIIGIVIILLMLLYGNTLRNGYNLDDELVTINHKLTSKGISAIPEIFKSPYYSDEMGYRYEYRPVVLTSFAIEHSLFGESPRTSHIINLLLYAVCCLLIFKLSQMLWKNNLFFPCAVTLLFIVHPLHTEAVSSIKNRDEIISLIGGLTTLFFAIIYCEKGNIISLLFIPLFLLLGLLSKMSAFSFVLFIPLWLTVTNASVKKIIVVSLLILIPAIWVLKLRDMETRQIILTSLVLLTIYSFVFVLFRIKIAHYFSRSYLTDFTFPDKFVLTYSIHDIVILLFSFGTLFYSITTKSLLPLLIVFPVLLLVPYRKGSYGIFDLITPSLFIAVTGVYLPVLDTQWLYLIFFISLISHTNIRLKKQLVFSALLLLLLGLSRAVKESNIGYLISIFPVLFLAVDFILKSIKLKKNQLKIIWVILLIVTFSTAILLNGRIKSELLIFPVAGLLSSLINSERYKLILIAALSLLFTLNVLQIQLPVIKFNSQSISEASYDSVVMDTITNPAYNLADSVNIKISLVQNEDRPLDFVEFPLGFNSTISEKIGTAAFVLGHYFKMMFIPYPMCFYYGYNKINVKDLYNFWSVCSLIVYVLLGMSVIYFARKYPVYSFGITVYLSSIFLFSNLVSPVAGMIGDRLTFVASFGFCIAIGYILNQFYDRFSAQNKKIIIAGFSIVLVLYSGLTIARNTQWKDHMTLYKHDIKHLEESAQAHNLLAKRLMLESFQERSLDKQYKMRLDGIKHYERAIAIYPDFFNPHIDLGKAYLMVNRLEDAARMYLNAAEMDTTYYDSWLQAGGIFVQLQKYPQAIFCFEKVIAKDKSYFQAYNSLSEVYFRQKNFEKAIEINLRAIELFPGSYDPVVNTGKTYFTMGDKKNALIYFEKAYLLNPNDRNLVLAIANIYKEFGENDKANFYLTKANQMNR